MIRSLVPSMTISGTIAGIFALGLGVSAVAQTSSTSAAAAGAQHPCKQIEQQCEAAGFKRGQAKEGTGLWVDCIDPIMRGAAQPAAAKIKLPAVSSTLIAECKAKKPNFGEKK